MPISNTWMTGQSTHLISSEKECTMEGSSERSSRLLFSGAFISPPYIFTSEFSRWKYFSIREYCSDNLVQKMSFNPMKALVTRTWICAQLSTIFKHSNVPISTKFLNTEILKIENPFPGTGRTPRDKMDCFRVGLYGSGCQAPWTIWNTNDLQISVFRLVLDRLR